MEERANVANERAPHPALSASMETVQFRRPSDEALQLLPGRLEVLSGLALPREIRFVRLPGERPEVILGREPGNSPQHVSLPSSTVSRQHARLDFSGGRWSVTNLSRTNPVVVNDTTLSNMQGERALVDGDRIELGDVVLRFCAH
jgi:pSer/pThr/pTyr-binding forkhead associated (FHA) protein